MIRRHQAQLEMRAGDEELVARHGDAEGKSGVAGTGQGEIRLSTSDQE